MEKSKYIIAVAINSRQDICLHWHNDNGDVFVEMTATSKNQNGKRHPTQRLKIHVDVLPEFIELLMDARALFGRTRLNEQAI